MSCRALKRDVELLMLDDLVAAARMSSASSLREVRRILKTVRRQLSALHRKFLLDPVYQGADIVKCLQFSCLKLNAKLGFDPDNQVDVIK